MDEKVAVNYIYFGILFFILSFLHVYHILLIENVSPLHYGLYIFCAMGQCFFEITGLALINCVLVRYCSKIFHLLFIVLTFLLFLAHVVDFSTIRILGMTIWYIFGFVFAESLDNFIEMLYATNLPIISWITGGIGAVVLLVSGIFFFQKCDQWARKKPWVLSQKSLLFSMGAIFSALIGAGFFTPSEGAPCIAALPWKTTFASSRNPHLKIGHLKAHCTELEHKAKLQSLSLKAVRKPNIFLFIAESLRADFLTPFVAPHLSTFQALPLVFSAANGTHLSWFSIFHSVYPFYWDERHPQKWRSGSLPLQMLKEAGYQVHVYSASRLKYYRMDERLFGEDKKLADNLHLFGQNAACASHENDSACMAALLQDLDHSHEGNLFVIFLDSTHFGYSWPLKETLLPAPPAINYLNVAYSNQSVEGVKNRYRNAVHFIDTLFGQFWEKLKKNPAGKEAVVVFTGDHGEEFFEEGCIFHASHLSAMQTRVPLYLHLGSKKIKTPPLASHLDIFPTLLHHIFGQEVCSEWFDGESLLKPRRKSFVVATRYNASRTPFEFLIHNGARELTARLKGRGAIECIAHRDQYNRALDLDAEAIKSHFQEPLEVLFPCNTIYQK